MAALLGSAELLASDRSLTSTHSGNPLCCAAALATLQAIEDEGVVKRASEIGAAIYRALYYPWRARVYGRGAVYAIWMNHNPRHDPQAIDLANRVVELAATRGLLLLKTGAGTVKIGPPLTIPFTELLYGLEILEGCLKEVV